MPFDQITEEIAHFIGSFLLSTEQPRFRTEHDGFDRDAEDFTDPEKLLNVTISVSAPYALVSLATGIGYTVIPLPLPEPFFLQSVYLQVAGAAFGPVGQSANLSTTLTALVPQQNGGFPGLEFYAPPPSSMAVIIDQNNALFDSDTLGLSGLSFATPEAQDLALGVLMNAAAALVGPGVTEASAEAYGGRSAQAMPDDGEGATTAYGGVSDEATIHVLSGEGIFGIHSDGVILEDAPVLDEAVPELPNQGDEDLPTHVAVTGGNVVVNEAYFSLSLTDAPVIAVAGNSHSAISISQVNVIADLDMINGITPTAAAHHNTLQNIGSVFNPSSQPEPESDVEAGEDVEIGEDPVFPTNAAVVRIEGDVLNLNQVYQVNYVVDNNVVSMEFSADGTFWESGGNLVANMVSLLELTYIYDLIVVGGDIVQHTVVSQVNVLLDDDFVTYGPNMGVDLVHGENLLHNEVTINTVGIDTYMEMPTVMQEFADSLAEGSDAVPSGVFEHDAFEGQDVISVLYVEGDLITYQSIEQINIVGNSDQVALGFEEQAIAAGAEVSVTTGANALVNIAAISELGVDSEVYAGGEVYSDAFMHQAGLVVAEDSALLGESDGLVSEAVAFLMDESSPEDASQQNHYGDAIVDDAMGNDPMGGILA